MDESTFKVKREALVEQCKELEKLLNDNSLPNEIIHTANSTLKRQRNLLEDPYIKIGFIGKYSSGKSTLVNALLGRGDFLPEQTNITTAVPTYICPSTEEEEDNYKLVGLTQEQFNTLGRLLKKELEKNIPQATNMTFPEINNAVQSLLQRQKSLSVVQDALYKQVKEYIKIQPNFSETHKNNANLEDAQAAMKDPKSSVTLNSVVCEINTQTPIPSDTILVDLPGLDAPNPYHHEIIYKFIQEEAHAIIFTLPPLSLFGQVMTEAISAYLKYNSKAMAMWVINQWDQPTEGQKKKQKTISKSI